MIWSDFSKAKLCAAKLVNPSIHFYTYFQGVLNEKLTFDWNIINSKCSFRSVLLVEGVSSLLLNRKLNFNWCRESRKFAKRRLWCGYFCLYNRLISETFKNLVAFTRNFSNKIVQIESETFVSLLLNFSIMNERQLSHATFYFCFCLSLLKFNCRTAKLKPISSFASVKKQ